MLEKEKIKWYFDLYFSPDETKYLHIKLNSNRHGIHAEHLHFDKMIHAFLIMERLVPDEREEVYGRIGDFLNN